MKETKKDMAKAKVLTSGEWFDYYDIDKSKPFLFTIRDVKLDKTRYFIKFPEVAKATVLTSGKWFDYYDQDYQVAPPLTLG